MQNFLEYFFHDSGHLCGRAPRAVRVRNGHAPVQAVGAPPSQVELALLSHGQDLLTAVLETASSSNRLDGPMSLHLDLRILFPAADVRRHVVKHDLLLEELIHLALDRVLIAGLNERGSVVDASHRVKVLVLARVDAAHSEVVVEKVLAVTPVGHTIVDE